MINKAPQTRRRRFKLITPSTMQMIENTIDVIHSILARPPIPINQQYGKIN
ncbi:MAG: hypothetical protein WA840_00425 [Caulobacteraceae bacterium]